MLRLQPPRQLRRHRLPEKLAGQGCRMAQVEETVLLEPAPGLRMAIACGDPEGCIKTSQRNALQQGSTLSLL